MLLNRRRHLIPTLAVCGGLCFGAVAPSAMAADADAAPDAADAVAAFDAAAPDSSKIRIEALGSSTLPDDPQQGVTLGHGDSQLRVSLPESAAAAQAEDGGAGRAVYEGTAATTIVQSTSTGVTIATVSERPDATSERFAYKLDLPDGAALSPNADGSVTIAGQDGASLGTIAKPWAKDSTGAQLPTSYQVDGSTLVQTVQTDQAVGAVVADPSIEWHWYWINKARVWFNRGETETFYRNLYGPALASTVAGYACGYIPIWYIKAACQAFVVTHLADFVSNVTQAHNRRKCLTVDVKWLPRPDLDWQDRDC